MQRKRQATAQSPCLEQMKDEADNITNTMVGKVDDLDVLYDERWASKRYSNRFLYLP